MVICTVRIPGSLAPGSEEHLLELSLPRVPCQGETISLIGDEDEDRNWPGELDGLTLEVTRVIWEAMPAPSGTLGNASGYLIAERR